MKLLVLVLIAVVHAKYVKSTIELSKDKPWAYITKFGMDIGTGSWRLKAKMSKGNKVYSPVKEYHAELQVYRDDYWADLDYTADCSRKTSPRLHASEIYLSSDGAWTRDQTGSLEETSSPHIWVFVLADCEQLLGDHVKVKLEFSVYNTDDSHVSVEDQGLLSLYCYLAVVFFVALGANIYETYRRFVHSDELDTQLLVLNLAISLQFFSLLLEILNLSAYQSNGNGVAAFELLSRFSDEISQLTLIMLLITIAEGWTVAFPDFPSVETNSVGFIIAGLAKLVLIALGKLSEDSYDKFSYYESVPGKALLLLRLGLYVWFLTNISALFSQVTGRVKVFVSRLTLTGSLFFLSQPVVVIASLLFAPYLRNWIVIAGSVSIQTASMLGLSLMFTRQKSEYNKVRATGNSLPGFKDN
jgi:hypothetical protein